MFGLQAVADAEILVSSHFHHLTVTGHGGRVHIQTPANDPGSAWCRNLSGAQAAAGTRPRSAHGSRGRLRAAGGRPGSW